MLYNLRIVLVSCVTSFNYVMQYFLIEYNNDNNNKNTIVMWAH